MDWIEAGKRGDRCTEQIERRIEAESQQSARMELGGSPRETSARPQGIPGLCNHQFAYPIQFWSHSSRSLRVLHLLSRDSPLQLSDRWLPSSLSLFLHVRAVAWRHILLSSLSQLFAPNVSSFSFNIFRIVSLRHENLHPYFTCFLSASKNVLSLAAANRGNLRSTCRQPVCCP